MLAVGEEDCSSGGGARSVRGDQHDRQRAERHDDPRQLGDRSGARWERGRARHDHEAAEEASGVHHAGGIGGLISMRDADGGTNYVCFYDANGNLGQLIDRSDGSVDAKYEYDAYGNNLLDASDPNESGPYADDNPIRFSTKYFDAELDYADTSNDGLYYFGYRYYTSRPGRWITRDPLHELDTWNLYRFVWNDPCTACDPDGLQTTKPTTKPALFPCIRYAFSDTWLTRPHLLRAYVSDAVKATGTAGATTGFATEATFVWGRQYSKIFVCCVEGKLKFLWGEPTIATQIRTMGIPMELRFIVLAAQISVSWHNVEIIALMSAWEPADREGRIVLQKLAQRKAARPVPGQWKKHEAKPPKGGRRVRSDEFPCKRLLPPRGEIKKRAGAPPKPVPWP